MRRTRIVAKKEWADIAKNRSLLLMMTLMPLILVAVPFLYVFIALQFVGQDQLTVGVFHQALEMLIAENPSLAGLPLSDSFQVLLYQQSTLFLLVIPLMVSMSIATFSIIGEKQSRSLEPLLATPIKTWELLLGKSLSAAIPAVLVTWLCSLIYLGGVFAFNSSILSFVVTPQWFIIVFLIAPLITLFSLGLGVTASSRSNDPRSAQNWGAVLILPLLLIIIGPIFGLFPLTLNLLLLLALGLAILDGLVLYLGVHLFQREAILTKWR